MIRSRIDKMKAWYVARPQREQQVLRLGIWVLAIGLVLQLNDWALNQRSVLSAQLAERQRDFVGMQAQADELQRLSGVRDRPAVISMTPDAAIAETASSRKLEFKVENTTNGVAVFVSGHADQIIDWLAALHADHRLSVAQLELKADGSQLEVSARLVVSVGSGNSRGG